MQRASMSEINPHPVSGAHLLVFGEANLADCGFVLRLPQKQIVVASLTKMQKAAYRHQKVQRGFELFADGNWQQSLRVRPVAQFIH